GLATGTLALCLWSGRRRRACDRRTAAFARSLLKIDIEDKCQDTGSRFVGAVPSYQLDWVVERYSRAAIGMPWRADGRQWRSPLANSKVPPLAPSEPRNC